MRLSSRVFGDYNLIKPDTVEGRKQIVGAMSAFMQKPQIVHNKMITAGTTQFTVDADFPTEVKELIEKIHLGVDEIDVGYLNFFDSRDFSGSNASGFRIRDVQSGLTFNKRQQGGKAQIYKVTGTETTVGFDTYGGGLEFDQAWFQDQEWWMIEDNATEFRSAWFRDKATTFYTLIGAIGAGRNIAYDTGGADQLAKDINTINTAAATLITSLQTAGYAVTANTVLKILSPIQLKARLNRALAAINLLPGADSAALKIEYNVEPVYSLNVLNAGAASTDKWYLGAPGIKNKIGEKMPLTVFSDFKMESFATTVVGWGRYGAYLNENQFQRLATA